MKEKHKEQQKNKQIKKWGRGTTNYSERMRAKWFCCACKLGFLRLICNASLIFKLNLESALSIFLKQRELHESKHVALECRCLKIWDLLSFFDMLFNPSFKITTSFANIARTTASTTSKFIYWERFQIIRNWVFVWKIIFNFEWIKN